MATSKHQGNLSELGNVRDLDTAIALAMLKAREGRREDAIRELYGIQLFLQSSTDPKCQALGPRVAKYISQFNHNAPVARRIKALLRMLILLEQLALRLFLLFALGVGLLTAAKALLEPH